MNVPKILHRDNNGVKLSWENVFPDTQNKQAFVLEMFDSVTPWKTVYWGCKKTYKVEGLEPCTCYNFRLKKVGSNEWLNFKAASDVGQYMLMHMNRAVKFNKIPLMKKIVQTRPLLLEWENKEFKTPLMQVAESGEVSVASTLIGFGANVNTVTIGTYRSPLMLAVFYGKLEVAKLFIEKGADINAKDVNNWTILHFAVNANKIDSVKFALEEGSDVNAQDSMKFTPLLRAVFLHSSREIIEELFENGADPDLKDKKGLNFQKHCHLANRLDLLDLVPKKEEVIEYIREPTPQPEENKKLKQQFYISQSPVNNEKETEQDENKPLSGRSENDDNTQQ